MAKALSIEELLKNGSKVWNDLRRENKVQTDCTGATFAQLFSANADLSGLTLIGSEWEKCDLSKVSFRDADLSNSYFHGGRLQECDFRGAKLHGVTFEHLKLLRCDFTNAEGLDELEFDDCDMDRVMGLGGADAPPPAAPPAVGITSFTREQRAAAIAAQQNSDAELPPFRPTDEPNSVLTRWLRHVSNPPPWVLDVPTMRLAVPVRMGASSSLENLYREAVKARLEGRKAVPDLPMVHRAKEMVSTGSPDSALATVYLVEVGETPPTNDAAREVVRSTLERAYAHEDDTSDVDPRTAAALAFFKGSDIAGEHLGEARMRLAACRLFAALLEAGFNPENNWEEAVDSTQASLDLAHTATNGQRDRLSEMFRTFSSFPEDIRMRRLAYNAETVVHLEALVAGAN